MLRICPSLSALVLLALTQMPAAESPVSDPGSVRDDTTDAVVEGAGVKADPDPAKEGIDTKLPNVLIIGDSISLGYTPFLAASLKGKANVFHSGGLWNENASSSSYTLSKPKKSDQTHIDRWLAFQDIKCKTAPRRPGSGSIEIHNPTVDFSGYQLQWNVVIANWGMWEVINDGKPANAVSKEAYVKNLTILFGKMQATGAHLLWASTTPAPAVNKRQRRDNDIVAYNAAAKPLAESAQATVVDLYALVKPRLCKEWQAGGDETQVHLSDIANRFLAEHLLAAVSPALGRVRP